LQAFCLLRTGPYAWHQDTLQRDVSGVGHAASLTKGKRVHLTLRRSGTADLPHGLRHRDDVVAGTRRRLFWGRALQGTFGNTGPGKR